MSNSGPHFDSEGNCYYVVNGHSVWASQHTGSSSGERAASVADAYYTHGAPQQSASWPPRNAPSSMKARLMSGYPTTRFGGGQSQGSGPAAGSEYMDPYRDAMDPQKNSRGPPLDSPFVENYNKYKDEDTAAESAEREYKNYVQSAPRVSARLRAQNPGVYAGQPLGTKEWHERAATYAYQAAQLFLDAAEHRDGMGADYIGYDTKGGASGHQVRAGILKGKGDKLMEKYHQHSYSHGGS